MTDETLLTRIAEAIQAAPRCERYINQDDAVCGGPDVCPRCLRLAAEAVAKMLPHIKTSEAFFVTGLTIPKDLVKKRNLNDQVRYLEAENSRLNAEVMRERARGRP